MKELASALAAPTMIVPTTAVLAAHRAHAKAWGQKGQASCRMIAAIIVADNLTLMGNSRAGIHH